MMYGADDLSPASDRRDENGFKIGWARLKSLRDLMLLLARAYQRPICLGHLVISRQDVRGEMNHWLLDINLDTPSHCRTSRSDLPSFKRFAAAEMQHERLHVRSPERIAKTRSGNRPSVFPI